MKNNTRLREENQDLKNAYAHKKSSNMFQYVASGVMILGGIALSYIAYNYFTTVKLLERMCIG